MKKLVVALALIASVSSVSAGGLEVPAIEAPVIVEDTSSSAADFVIPLLVLAVLAALAGNATPVPMH